MNILTLRHLLLIAHLSGFVLMAGTTITEFVAFRILIFQFKFNGEVSGGITKLMSGLTTVLTAGGILLSLSGIGLTWITGGIFLHQVWLQLKLLLIVVLALNGVFFGGRQLRQIEDKLSKNSIEADEEISGRVFKLNVFYTMQIVIFITIVTLAIFKLN
ncbi:DUF2214 family protein [Mucilaginibacter gilvus]|uniref:DUF2214 family protein n=1 Tax=Mucilaginibacter gilvus TaxID=2305909 RepID=A0A3S3UW32_9SPHI|nr:DUF2214 family protein [Mucilaginibacter gilvus]RWY55917.1 DUF2214 family protein [Mucilaginibacter gilvus]